MYTMFTATLYFVDTLQLYSSLFNILSSINIDNNVYYSNANKGCKFIKIIY